MTLDPELLKILACPESKKPLVHLPEKNLLVCRESGLAYPIRNGVPILLVDEAEKLDDAKLKEILG
ncbi:MAG: hypothetical protein COB53_07425 [Elusimicrobia bacterium]|nr:MAG: hypothetical protein COB53_07425 [Elusimicrobiota bacterium]